MGLTFQEETLDSLFADPDSAKIFQDHWKELANNTEEKPLDLDHERYAQLNRMGILRVLTVRNDGCLIGYASFMVSPHLRYRTWNYAVSDVYYVVKDQRNKGIGFLLFEHIKEWLKTNGVKACVVQEKVGHPHAKMFDALGFKLVENVYEIML